MCEKLEERTDSDFIVVEVECPHCGGTGVFPYWSAKEGAGYPCAYCEKGKMKIKYKPFTGTKIREGITRIFPQVGRTHFGNDHTFENGVTIKFSEGGCSYEEWQNGEQPKPVEEYYCPAEYDNQYRCTRCPDNIKQHQAIPLSCLYIFAKEECWTVYHSREVNADSDDE